MFEYCDVPDAAGGGGLRAEIRAITVSISQRNCLVARQSEVAKKDPPNSLQWKYTTSPEGDDVLWLMVDGEWLRLGTLAEAAELIGGLYIEAQRAKAEAQSLLERAKRGVN